MAESERWSALIDGALPAYALTELQQHLTSCTDCAEYVAQLRSVVYRARITRGVEPPSGIWLSLQAQLQSERLKTNDRRGSQFLNWRTGRLFAAAASTLIVVGAGALLRNGRQSSIPEAFVDRNTSEALRRSLLTLDAAIAQATIELARSPDDPYLNRILASAREARTASIANAAVLLQRPE